MPEAFDKAFELLMEYEGGYSNDLADRGGETRFGISKRAYPDEDIANLTLERAKEIYLRDYWNPLRLGEVSDAAMAGEIFEQAVNFGLRAAARNTQEALNYLGQNVGIDGEFGPQTLAAINGFKDARLLFKVVNGLQFCRYLNIVKVNPGQKRFARGWLRRVAI